MLRDLISTDLITHPHLDHIAGFAINTAACQQTASEAGCGLTFDH